MSEMDIYRQMHSGELYDPGDSDLTAIQFPCMDLMYEYNHTRPSDFARQQELLEQMFAEIGEDCYVTPPFYANWGGHHVHFGKGIYCNFGLTIVDDTHVYVGDYTEFGPNVTIATAGHPILPELRGAHPLQYNLPVRIGSNCWIGAGAVIMPGVTIGDGSVIGAGSVVTRDIPSGVVAVGNPCRVQREIGERDREYYYRDRKIKR